MTEAVNTQKIYLAVQLNGTWRKFYELKSTPDIGPTVNSLDASNFDSIVKEHIKGLSDPGDSLDFTMNFMPSGTENSNYDLIKELTPGAIYDFRIGYPQAKSQWSFRGDWNWRVAAASVDAVQDITFTIIPRTAPMESTLDEQCVLTYDLNGGTAVDASASLTMTYDAGDDVPVLPASAVTAPTGKVLIGWNTQSDNLGTAYQPGSTFKIFEDTTLYAIWGDAQ